MHTLSIIERAFQLARDSGDLNGIRATLRKEGYANVDAHLGGGAIKGDLKRVFARHSA
jgi:hypothetical protein